MVNKSVVKTLRQYLKAIQKSGITDCYAVVFGSQAAGHQHFWSDIDLLVVSPYFDANHKREDVDLLWRIAARIDSRIEPIPVGKHQFEEDDSSAVIEIARRDGQIITQDI